MSVYTLAMLGLALLLVSVLVANRRRAAAPKGDAGAQAVARVLAETAATAAAAPSGPMPLSPPSSDADLPAGWTMPAPVPAADAAPERPFPSPFEPAASPVWADDEIVTAPGWPMPGELDLSWAGPAAVPAADAAAQPEVGDAAAAPGGDADAGMPRWQPPVTIDLGPLTEPPAAAAVPEATAAGTRGDDAVGYGPAEPAPAWTDALAVEGTGGFDMPSWDGAGPAVAPPALPFDDALSPEDGGAAIAWLETPSSIAREAAPAPAHPGVPEGDAAAIAWLAPEPPVRSPLEPAGADVVAWLDAPATHSAPAGPRGRFAVGGTAQAAGDQAVAAVTFGQPLETAPVDWRVGPVSGATPGTLVLEIEGLLNGAADSVAVMDAPGFAPSPEGFTVRAAALTPGPFAVAGTFRIA